MLSSYVPSFSNDWSEYDIVILGEVHDNLHAHIKQADLLREISPSAVVFEMLDPTAAKNTNRADRNDIDAIREASQWDQSNWPPFKLYQPIFEALGNAAIVGAETPSQMVKQAVSSDALSVFGEGGEYFGLHLPLPDDQKADRQKLQFEAHCEAIPLDFASRMVEAQRLRDAFFAKVTLDALNLYGAPVVLIAGYGHARLDWGVPASIKFRRQTTRVYSVGILEHENKIPFDQTFIVPVVDRDDPCAAFQGRSDPKN